MGAVLIFFIFSFTTAQLFSSVISVTVPFEHSIDDSTDGRRKFTSEPYIDATMYGKHPLKQREHLKALMTRLGDDDNNIVKKTYKFIYTKPTETQVGEHNNVVTMEANQKLAQILRQYILKHNAIQNEDLTEINAGKMNDADMKGAPRTSHRKHRLFNIEYNLSNNGKSGIIYKGFVNNPFGMDVGGKYGIHKDYTIEKSIPDKENNLDINIFMKDTNYPFKNNHIVDIKKSNIYKIDYNKTIDGANLGVVEIIDAQNVPKEDKEEGATAVDEVIAVKPNNGSITDDIDKRNPIHVINNQTQKLNKVLNDKVLIIDLESSKPETNTNQEILGVVPIVPQVLNHTKSSNETGNILTDIIHKIIESKVRNIDNCLSKSCEKGIKNKISDVEKRIPQYLKRNVCKLAKLNLDNFWVLMSRYLGLEKGYKEDLNVVVQLNNILSIFKDLKAASDAGIPINKILKIIIQTIRSGNPVTDILEASTSKYKDYVLKLLKMYPFYSPENIGNTIYLNKNVPKLHILPADDFKSKPNDFIQFPNANTIDGSTVQYNYFNIVPKKNSGLFGLKGELNIENYPANPHRKQRPNKKITINKPDIKAEDNPEKSLHDITVQPFKKNYTYDVDNIGMIKEVQNHKYIILPHNSRGSFNNYYSRDITPQNDREINLRKLIHLLYKFDDKPDTSEDVPDQREIAYDIKNANQNIWEELRNNPLNLNAYQLALYNANPGYFQYTIPYSYGEKDTDGLINFADKLNVYTPQREKEYYLIRKHIEGMPILYDAENYAYNIPNRQSYYLPHYYKAEEELKAIGGNGEDMQEFSMLPSTKDNDAVKQLLIPKLFIETAGEVQRPDEEIDPSQAKSSISKESIRVGQNDNSDAKCSPR